MNFQNTNIMAKKDPAFLFYSKDWIDGTAEMTPAEKGVYIDLLAYQHQRGDLPTDVRRLCLLTRLQETEFNSIWLNLKEKFIVDGERMYNRKLTECMTERSDKGKKNKICGIFASLLRKSDLQKKDYNFMREGFKVDDFTMFDTDSITERLTEWYNERLKSIVNGNANEDANKLLYNTFIEKLNKITGRSFKGDEKSQRQFNARISEGATIESFEIAITGCFNDQYHKENPKYLTPEFITRSDKYQKYSFVKPKKETEPQTDMTSLFTRTGL